jgi:peptide chain release factor subunit 3
VHLNIVFIGHADARKSMMGGSLLYLCRMIDRRTMEKYEREAKEAGRETLVPLLGARLDAPRAVQG